ncbi:methyltransferase domain-containing protein, partial [Streptomyces sp. SID625]|nr:methyltransferase domain-containing protein [Streptomyces sp. SID625]
MVARQLDEQIAGRFPVGQRLRVLDVGMGQGTQALRLARAGHQVTGLERDQKMIAVAREALAAEPEGIRARMRIVEGDGRDTGVHFLPGSFDVVLCHGVLMYVEEPDALLAGLARMLAPGGLLSLLVRNADALALRPGLMGDWPTALAAFDSTVYRNRLGLDVRADRLADLTATLAGIGAPLHAWYGVRVFTDTAADGAE